MKLKTLGGASGLSILLSSLSSAVALCCFAPWVVPLLGVSGAILFARLGPYRPYFIGVSALLMAVAVVGAYRSRKACAADPAARRRHFWLNLVITLGVLVLILSVFAGRIELYLQTHLSS